MPADLSRISRIGRHKCREIRVRHLLQAILLERRILATVVADLVIDGPCQKIGTCELLFAYGPPEVLPAEPTSNLSVRRKQRYPTSFSEFKRKHQAGVVRSAIDLHGQIGAGVEPVVIDAPPRLIESLRKFRLCFLHYDALGGARARIVTLNEISHNGINAARRSRGASSNCCLERRS